MRILLKGRLLLALLLMGVLCTPVICHGGELKTEGAPVYGRDIEDGSYEVQVESSSSMFRVVKARLNVEGGSMTADITLSGTGYLKLFMGTGEEALRADEENYIPYVEDEEGAYTYTIPIEALNVEFSCAAYSRRKETWYDRELIIWSSSLPEETIKPGPVPTEKGSGDYTVEVSLRGGTGRASIASPARVSVSEEAVAVFIEWSSPDFDYMVVNGEKYTPVNPEGNSVFRIPVLTWEQELDVIADTVAMSSPHEIEYTLVFYWDTMKRKTDGLGVLGGILFLTAAAVVPGCMIRYRGRNKRKAQHV